MAPKLGLIFGTSGSLKNTNFTIYCDVVSGSIVPTLTITAWPWEWYSTGNRTPRKWYIQRDLNSVAPSDSGVYTCSVMVGGVSESITAVLGSWRE